MKIALAQMKMTPEMEINYQKSISLIEEAAQKGASLILFPEIQLTPFFPQFKDENVSDYVMLI
jgi:predicted amidohydrolase